MVRLRYDLDEIKEFGYETGRCRARVKSITQKASRAKKPMIVFEWEILTGPNKKKKISSFCSLQQDSLSNLKQHLESLGLKGQVDESSDRLIGKIAVIVLSESASRDDPDRSFISVSSVLPKDTPLTEPDEDDEEDEEEFEEEDEYEEEEDEEEDEDWDEDEDEEEEAPAPRRKTRR